LKPQRFKPIAATKTARADRFDGGRENELFQASPGKEKMAGLF
jgi:hypothetical protein